LRRETLQIYLTLEKPGIYWMRLVRKLPMAESRTCLFLQLNDSVSVETLLAAIQIKTNITVSIHGNICLNTGKGTMVFLKMYYLAVSGIFLVLKFLVTLYFQVQQHYTCWNLSLSGPQKRDQGINDTSLLLHNKLKHYIQFERNKARCKHLMWYYDTLSGPTPQASNNPLSAELTLSAGMVGIPILYSLRRWYWCFCINYRSLWN
jgi:hypothetical protein